MSRNPESISQNIYSNPKNDFVMVNSVSNSGPLSKIDKNSFMDKIPSVPTKSSNSGNMKKDKAKKDNCTIF